MNKVGFLFFNSVIQFLTAMNPVVLTFPAERGVFLKEESSKLYRTFSYFIGSNKLLFIIKKLFIIISSLATTTI